MPHNKKTIVMKQILKIKIANLATWIMIATVGLIILWFIGFIVSNTFNLNVFTTKTKDFFFSLIGFAFVLVACAAILNISLNISLIADSKIQDFSLGQTKTIFNKKFFFSSGMFVLTLICFLFLGDYLTRENEKNKLVLEAKDLIERYEQSIDEITLFIQDTATVGKIPEILKFLSSQKYEFPTVTLLTSDQYNNETVYLQVSSWTSKKTLKEPLFDHSFYKCSRVDCDYLNNVFEKRSHESYLWTEKNDYKFYFPIEKNGKRIILLFAKHERSGKIGY